MATIPGLYQIHSDECLPGIPVTDLPEGTQSHVFIDTYIETVSPIAKAGLLANVGPMAPNPLDRWSVDLTFILKSLLSSNSNSSFPKAGVVMMIPTTPTLGFAMLLSQ